MYALCPAILTGSWVFLCLRIDRKGRVLYSTCKSTEENNMKVTKEGSVGFKPIEVTITIETQAELDALREARSELSISQVAEQLNLDYAGIVVTLLENISRIAES
jgi:hypothetical protein